MRVPALIVSFQHGVGCPIWSGKVRKRNRRLNNWKEEIKLFDDNMILYIENSKNQVKLLKLAVEFNNVARYQANLKEKKSNFSVLSLMRENF